MLRKLSSIKREEQQVYKEYVCITTNKNCNQTVNEKVTCHQQRTGNHQEIVTGVWKKKLSNFLNSDENNSDISHARVTSSFLPIGFPDFSRFS